MTRPKVQLLVFEGCPLAEAARRSLREALAEVGFSDYEEVDLLAPETPEDLRGWGSPTILIEGRELMGGSKGEGLGCRVYSGPASVPAPAEIASAIAAARDHETE